MYIPFLRDLLNQPALDSHAKNSTNFGFQVPQVPVSAVAGSVGRSTALGALGARRHCGGYSSHCKSSGKTNSPWSILLRSRASMVIPSSTWLPLGLPLAPLGFPTARVQSFAQTVSPILNPVWKRAAPLCKCTKAGGRGRRTSKVLPQLPKEVNRTTSLA